LATLGGKSTGGMNVYVRDLTRYLGQLGIHVDVYTRSEDEHVPHVVHDLGYGNRVVHIPAGPEMPLPKDELVSYLPQFVAEIEDFANRKNLSYDLIHSHYWMSGLAGRNLKKQWGVPLVHMFHTLGKMKNRVAKSDEAESLERIKREEEVLRVADCIIAATQAEVAQLQWLYAADTTKMSVIPPGVDVSHFYPIPEDEAKEYIGVRPCDGMLLFVGRIEPLKGVDTLIEAISIMHQKGFLQERSFCLAIIGGEKENEQQVSVEMKRLRELCNRYGLNDFVTFLGKQGQDTLPYYYSAAKVVIMPSHYESFGMVALEAMACGTPVVASQVGGLAYLVQDGVTGYHVPDQDPQKLGERLMMLLTDTNLRLRLGRQAADYARRYAWKNIAAQVVDVYKSCLQKQ
jgi:D-inositol-3-phosphate glycosyltransferase